MATLLERAGFSAVDAPQEADLIVVNTCGFIEPAREESRAVLRELAQDRRPGQQIIATGCYTQRNPDELTQAVPGIDGVIGTRHWMDVISLVDRLDGACPTPIRHLPGTTSVGQAIDMPRVAVQGASAYLKIGDGCRRSCAFCAIPLIKGPGVSRPAAAILDDAEWLAERGIREIILVAQDTTSYGRDLGTGAELALLLERMVAAVPQVAWIRTMYAYPGRITERLIETMARHPQILPYLDIPLQHAHPDVLRRMRRPDGIKDVRRTIERLRAAMPGIAIRTTFLAGYPGETESEFRTLLDFVAEMAFDRVGVFAYSHEDGTPAASLEDDVPSGLKNERCERLMEVQQPISLAKNQALVGQTLDVLIEGEGDGLSVGRSYRDAPEIDGLILIQGDAEQHTNPPTGEIIPARITAALEYDLVAELAE